MQNSSSPPQKIENLAVIRISGDDRLLFLQGQLSNDIEQLGNSWQFSGYCNPKGRLLALFRLWQHEDFVYAAVDASILEQVITRLRMYIMRSKVIIEILENAQCFGLVDTKLGASRFNLVIEGDTHRLNDNNSQLIVELGSEMQSPPLSTGLDWNATNILNGIPNITRDTYEMFVPQMINLDLINGVSFKKGCYTGQEIVARMHYLGKLKQRMYVCSLHGEAGAGDKVLLQAEDGNVKSAGNLVSVDQSNGVALAVLRIEMVESNSKFSLENNGELNVNNPQPYDFSL